MIDTLEFQQAFEHGMIYHLLREADNLQSDIAQWHAMSVRSRSPDKSSFLRYIEVSKKQSNKLYDSKQHEAKT